MQHLLHSSARISEAISNYFRLTILFYKLRYTYLLFNPSLLLLIFDLLYC